MTRTTPRRSAALSILATVVALAGCESMSEREKGTAQGAAIGAAAGALIGAATGGSAGQSAVIGGVVGAVAGNLWSKNMEDKRKAMEAATAGTGIEVARTQDNQLQVNVPSDLSFDIGRADIKPALRPVLDQFAQGLDPKMRVRIVGHTDSTGSDAINDPLSLDRAASTRSYLAARGVDPARIRIEGHGARQPIASNDTERGRAQNRRVEIYVGERQQG